MNDKQETKMALRESYAHAQLEDEAFDREFECCRKMKSAKPEPAPHPELLPIYDNSKLRDQIKRATENVDKKWAKVGQTGNPDIAIATRLRKERDDLKERCSDLDLQVDSLEVQLSRLKLENVTLKDTVIALKECESVKEQEGKPIEWSGEGLPPVGCECHVDSEVYAYRVVYSSEHVVIVQNKANDGTAADGLDIILDLHKHNYTFEPIESPEQKAQREREEAISEIESTLHDRIHFNNPYLPRTIGARLYDAGYRKQP